MEDDNENNEINALDELLDAERTALLKGDLVALADMLPAKEVLIETLNARATDSMPRLTSLDGKVRRNQLLLDSALEGIREVTSKMVTLRRMRGTLETYGADGRKKKIEVRGTPSVERRA